MSAWLSAITRATGIVAAVLAVASLLFGALFSARATGQRLRPNWWLDLHNWLGGLALIFTGAHLVTVWLLPTAGIGLLQIFVPGTATTGVWGITWGVVAFYLFAAAVFTSWPRRLRRRTAWRVIHLGSIVGVGLALLHTYQSGSDSTAGFIRVGLVVLVGVATYGVALRLLNIVWPKRIHS